MKRILSALAATLRAATSTLTTAWTFCRDTGRWIGKTVVNTATSIGGGGGGEAVEALPTKDLVAPPEYGTAADLIEPDDGAVDKLLKKSQALLDTLGLVPPSPGDNYDRVKRICADLTAGGWGDEWDIVKLSYTQASWLEHMSIDMHKLVAEASRDELIAHMKGGKGIKGLIRCDKESIEDWKHSLKIEKARAAYEVEAPVIGEPKWAQGPMPACKFSE